MIERCKRGHIRTEANTGWYTQRGGKYRVCRTCRTCRSMAQKLKYRNDAVHREHEKIRTKAVYHRNIGFRALAQALDVLETERGGIVG